MALLAHINLKSNPNLIRLLLPGGLETLETFLKLPPEKILLRWFNYHLAQAVQQCATPRSTAQHHAAPGNTMQHRATPAQTRARTRTHMHPCLHSP